MGTGVHDFRDLVCWRLCNELKREILKLTDALPASRDFTYRDQVRDSSASAAANIAEGFGYYRPRQVARFLSYARASIVETMNHLADGRDRGYIDDECYSRLMNLSRAAKNTTTKLMLAKQRQADKEETRDRRQ